MSHLTAAPPVVDGRPVGRRTVHVVDEGRDDRSIALEIWYPTDDDASPLTRYDLLPGVSFEAASARHETTVAAGPWPLVVFSHGRTGMRFAYTLLCEALAAHGMVVVAPDHAGDTLLDWLLGTFVDDTTNEANRVGDLAAVLSAVLDGSSAVPADITAAVDRERVVGIGHSYGAHGLFAAVAGRRGAAPERRMRALVSLQGYTRQLSDSALGRVETPTLLVASADDRTTPPGTDADRPTDFVPGRPLWRLDLERAGHQASSDMGLYAELADQVELPDIVRQYLAATTVDAVGETLTPYRELLRVQLDAILAFLAHLGIAADGRGAPDTAEGTRLTIR